MRALREFCLCSHIAGLWDVSLASYSSFRIGGKADALLFPANERELASALLAELDLPKARFCIDLQKRSANDAHYISENGYDSVSFMAALNEGEPMLPINHVASGGEMARIVLALKCVIAQHDGLPTIIFDEVDSGVSGKTSRKIGYCLKKTAEGMQMLCITHSAQIASLADYHYLMKKQVNNGRTEASVSLLGREERIAELSRILGGIHITEAQRRAAADMLSDKT